MGKDVVSFLSWAAEPEMEERKLVCWLQYYHTGLYKEEEDYVNSLFFSWYIIASRIMWAFESLSFQTKTPTPTILVQYFKNATTYSGWVFRTETWLVDCFPIGSSSSKV